MHTKQEEKEHNYTEDTEIVLFKNTKIRKTLHDNEWYFSVIDIIEAFTESTDPHDYWYRMKVRVKNEENAELSTMCRRLKLPSSDGKKYATDCLNTLEQKIGRSIVTKQNYLKSNKSTKKILKKGT